MQHSGPENQKIFWGGGRGHSPLPRPSPIGEGVRGIPPAQTPPPRRLWRLDTRAFGARPVPPILKSWIRPCPELVTKIFSRNCLCSCVNTLDTFCRAILCKRTRPMPSCGVGRSVCVTLNISLSYSRSLKMDLL